MAKRKDATNMQEAEATSGEGEQAVTLQQLRRREQREHTLRHRAELADQVARGEDSLLASYDDRTRRALDHKLTILRSELQRLDAELAKGYGEAFAEFRERMNCEYIQLAHGETFFAENDAGVRTQIGRGICLFANGAWSNGRDVHSAPPTEPIRQLPIVMEYLRKALSREEKQFQRIRHYILEQSKVHGMGAGPLPVEKAFEDLKQSEENVTRLREKLDAAERQFAELRGPSARQLYQEQCERNQRAAQAAIQRALEMQI